MKHILLFIAISFGTGLFAQKDEVFAKLTEYGFATDALDHGMKDADATHAFKLKTTTVTDDKTEVEECHFDPTQPVGSKWILDTHDGHAPSKKQKKQFHKAHNTEDQNVNGKVDDNSWKIVSDDAEHFVVSFKYDKASLPKKFDFLGDCTGTAYFKKQTKTLEKATFVNDGPLHIKFFNVTKMNMVVNYKQFDGNFVMDTETLNMTVMLLGSAVLIKEQMEYSDYKKIK